MISNPKFKTYKNEDYLKFIRKKPCSYPLCRLPGEPHHVRRSYWGSGTSKKSHSYVCIPLCREHHEPKYEKHIEFERVIIHYLMEYIESKRKK